MRNHKVIHMQWITLFFCRKAVAYEKVYLGKTNTFQLKM